MSVTHPLLLVAGLLLALGLTLGAVLLSRRRAATIAATGLTVAGRAGRPVGLWLSLVGVFVLAVGMAGPTAELPVARSAGTVIIAMDVSNSMNATDVAPSRLAAAQQAASAFIDAQPDTVDLGVVGFDQGALTSSVVGQDRAATKAAVESLRISGGTSLASAILGSLNAITGKSVTIGKNGELPDLGHWGSATIVLFSDGEDSSGSDGADAVTEAATIAQNAGIRIDTVGVGTAQGTTVELDGYQLHTALDVDQLTAIATTTGGSYYTAADSEDLAGVASGIDLRLTVARQPVPLAGAFCGLALALLAAGAIITAVRTGRFV